MYSNVQGDFVATPVVGTNRITFSDFANNVISGDLSVLNFIKSEIYEVLANGTAVKLPTASLKYSDGQGLTLLQMFGNFNESDRVAVYIHGRDKGFDEENDAYKTTSELSGEISISETDWLTDSTLDSLQKVRVVKPSEGRVKKIRGRLDSIMGSGTYYLQLIDASDVPEDGVFLSDPDKFLLAPIKFQHVRGVDTQIISEFPGTEGIPFNNGLVWLLSSTEFFPTQVTLDSVSIDVYYK